MNEPKLVDSFVVVQQDACQLKLLKSRVLLHLRVIILAKLHNEIHGNAIQFVAIIKLVFRGRETRSLCSAEERGILL